MYMLRRRGPRTEPQGTPCLTFAQLEQKFSVFEDFFFQHFVSCYINMI